MKQIRLIIFLFLLILGLDGHGQDSLFRFVLECNEFGVESEGLISAKNNNKWGYIDSSAHIVIDFQFDYAFPFKDGFARVSKGKFNGFYLNQNYDYNVNTELVYTDTIAFINKKGQFITTYKFVLANDFKNGKAMVSTNGKDIFLLDTVGNLELFKENVKSCQNCWEYKNADSKEKIQATTPKLKLVYNNSKYGWSDSLGRVVIPCIYGYASDFHDLYAIVRKEPQLTNSMGYGPGLYGIINRNGDLITGYIFEYATNFLYHNLFFVSYNNKRGIIEFIPR